jgi:preprotein translocase subunit SecG
MSLVIGLLSLVLVVASVLLCLLILVQLPKKEAGMGAAFGADQAAALFGAGGGNALTKITKILAGTFLVLCLLISILTAQQSKARASRIRQGLDVAPAAPAGVFESGLPAGVTVPSDASAGSEASGALETITLPEAAPSAPTP